MIYSFKRVNHEMINTGSRCNAVSEIHTYLIFGFEIKRKFLLIRIHLNFYNFMNSLKVTW